jgi:hypothetical protein
MAQKWLKRNFFCNGITKEKIAITPRVNPKNSNMTKHRVLKVVCFIIEGNYTEVRQAIGGQFYTI